MVRDKLMMDYLKRNWRGIVIVVMMLFMFELVLGISNPPAVYCRQLGYTYTINKTDEGDIGVCQLPDGSSCKAWDFLNGKCGKEYSYCKREGYDIKTVSDSRCSYSIECAVCVLENGREIEVTKLMKLKLESGECGDGICTMGESYKNCPKDCPSGSADNYCDGLKDGKCDSDCERSKDLDCLCNKNGVCESKFENYVNCPEDCKKPSGFIWIYVIIGVMVAGLIIFFLKKRSSRTGKDRYNIYYGNK